MGPINWEGIKKDIRKGIKEGYIAMKEGALVASKKAGELTEEGKKQYKILELKTKIHKIMHDLGGRVYELMGSSSRVKSPVSDRVVKEMVAQIRGYEAQIAALEQQGAKKTGKASVRKNRRP
ncbi:MAG: hypothetical protein OEW15_08080 [Nitrospirota bacterium]|nr:hypothetical protein [Nitrospirota bacterium]